MPVPDNLGHNDFAFFEEVEVVVKVIPLAEGAFTTEDIFQWVGIRKIDKAHTHKPQAKGVACPQRKPRLSAGFFLCLTRNFEYFTLWPEKYHSPKELNMKLFSVSAMAEGPLQPGRGCDPQAPIKVLCDLVLAETKAEAEEKNSAALLKSCPGWRKCGTSSEEITKEQLEGFLKQL